MHVPIYFDEIETELTSDTWRLNGLESNTTAADRKALHNLFNAYKAPASNNAQINALHLAQNYLLSRGRTIFLLIQHLIKTHESFFENIQCVRDMGSGPGTFLLAAQQIGFKQYHAMELNPWFLRLSQYLASHLSQLKNIECQFQAVNYLSILDQFSMTDLCVMSYTLCENNLLDEQLNALMNNSARVMILEPGTPSGYQMILRARQQMLERGYKIFAPCTYQAKTCPLVNEEGHWCHFIYRLERSMIQKQLKQGRLGYEDEKYAYLLAYDPLNPINSELVNTHESEQKHRIVQKPFQEKHRIQFFVCSDTPKVEFVKKQDTQLFKSLKKKKRGDLL